MTAKKKFLLGSLFVSLSIVACAAFGLIGTKTIQTAYGAVVGSYHITFDHTDFVSSSFDEDRFETYFKVGRENAIDGKYDLYTYDEFTYAEDYSQNLLFGGEDYIVEKPVQANGYIINFAFSILTRANFDLGESKVVYSVYNSQTAKTTTTAIYFENWGEDGDRTVYCASYNAASDYNNSVKFTQIELYFSC